LRLAGSKPRTGPAAHRPGAIPCKPEMGSYLAKGSARCCALSFLWKRKSLNLKQIVLEHELLVRGYIRIQSDAR
jgi:hypothetical protein